MIGPLSPGWFTRERYCTPELPKPLSLLATILYLKVSSKFSTVPPVQTRKVLCLAGFSAVVCPVIVPSFTDQKVLFPAHPSRLLPSKMGEGLPTLRTARSGSLAALSLGLPSSAAPTA